MNTETMISLLGYFVLMLAIGLYALANRRAEGKTTTLRQMLLVRPAAGPQPAGGTHGAAQRR